MNPPRRGTPDFVLLFLTISLVGFGLVMVFSSSYSLTYSDDPLMHTKRQALFAALGVIAMFVLMNTPYATLKKLFIPYFLITVALLVAVLIVGEERNGARSWFGIGPFGGQPTEFAKFGIILYLSAILTKKGERVREFKKGLLPVLTMVGFVTLLILLQPDIGSAAILVLVSGLVIMVGGARFKHLFFLGLAALAAVAVAAAAELLRNEQSYRIKRFTTFLNPWEDPLGYGYQLIQSLYALGHGGITGAGFGRGIQKLHYLPYAHNDFIFAVIGEELGFVGASLFLLVYLIFLWRALLIALRAPDATGMLAGTGIVGLIAIQTVINIGGVIGALPITGVTLPFISYGGSSLAATLMAMGVLLSISRELSKQEKIKSESGVHAADM